jgi:hypothetical protein
MCRKYDKSDSIGNATIAKTARYILTVIVLCLDAARLGRAHL